MTWAGINNEHEFFSDHYVAEVFERDVKDLLDRWLVEEQSARADGTTGQPIETHLRTPYNQLSALSREAAETWS